MRRMIVALLAIAGCATVKVAGPGSLTPPGSEPELGSSHEPAAASSPKFGLGPALGGGFVPPTKIGGGGGSVPADTIEGTLTSGDLTVSTGLHTIGNYPGTSCVAGSAISLLSAAGLATCSAFLTNTNVAGTTNNLAKFTGTNTVGNSSATDNGSTFAISNVNVQSIRGIGAGFTSLNPGWDSIDTTAMGTGVGGSLILEGNYTSGGSHTALGAIKALKENATSGDFGGDLVLGARQNSSSDVSEILRLIGSNLSALFTAQNGVYVQDSATPSAVLRIVGQSGQNYIESGTSTGATSAPLNLTSMAGGTTYAQWDASGNFTAPHNEVITGTTTAQSSVVLNNSSGTTTIGGAATFNSTALVTGAFTTQGTTTLNNTSGTTTIGGATTFNAGLTSTAGTNTLGRVDGNTQSTSSSSGALVNDFVLGANTRYIEWNATTSIAQWTGMTGCSGTSREVYVKNVGSVSIEYYTQNGNSLAADRFEGDGCTGGCFIAAGQEAKLTCDVTNSRWMVGVHWDMNSPGPIIVNGTLGVTGATTLSSTANVVGNFSVNTSNFTVDAATGNTAMAGTLGVSGITTHSANVLFGSSSKNIHTSAPDGSTRPTVTGCGTSPTLVGNDHSGYVTVGTGGSSSCTITFHTAYTNATCTMDIPATATKGTYTVPPVTTAIVYTAALGAGAKIIYSCDDHT